jgi:O-antigen ligase
MAGESIQAISATSVRSTGAARAALNPCSVLVAAVVFFVPLAIDPFGLNAFLPVKQAVLLFGSALIALVAAVRFMRAAWRPLSPDGSPAHRDTSLTVDAFACSREDFAHASQTSSGTCLIGTALALWSWPLIVAPHALNPALHLGFGWACLSAYMIVFFAALRYAQETRNADSPQNFELLLGVAAVAALVMACHACLQAANADPLTWIVGGPVQESGRWRIFTTTGNPDWTAEFLAATAPIAVWWASRFMRGAAWLWLLFAIAILPTGSRLGLAGLLVGAAIYAWARHRDRRESRRAQNGPIIFLVSLTTLGSLVLFLRNDGYAAALLRWNDFHSVLGRLQLWQASLHLIAARPLDGYGLDHFALVLPDGLRAVAAPLDAIARSRMPDLLTAHAHNDFLEMSVETGMPGALLLLALFALGLQAARRSLDAIPSAIMNPSAEPRAPNSTHVATAAPALVASLGVLFILAMASAPLHTPATELLFWLVLGCVAGLAQAKPRDRLRQARAFPCAWPRAGSVAAICATLAVTVWTSHRAFALLAENRQAASAAALAATGQTRAAERLYESALARAPWDHESGAALASLLIDRHQSDAALRVLDRIDAWSQSRESWLARTQALMLKNDIRAALWVTAYATTAVPDFLRAQMLRAHLAARLGKTSEAEAAWHQILLSPQRSARAQRIMFEAAQASGEQAPEP